MKNVTVIDHPLVQHKLTLMRDKNTGTKDFRMLLNELSTLMAYEVTRDLPMEEIDIETPVAPMKARVLAGRKLGIVPILRAGLGMAEGVMELIPAAKVGHIGLYRDPVTHKPVSYYHKLPSDTCERDMIVVDPMLATGGSGSAAVSFIKQKCCSNIKFMSIIAAPEGLTRLAKDHPDVQIYTGCVDERLNEHGYILPGLGDAG
ncbi:MAG: uracil phosphoribosyltransferase, partial [Clostridiales bacterium]|nr:uracil phosphoribosyltransferase [Clostridiales bacterium]MDY5702320.1 uracil phosphoribosyltransferase [Eubacteriales bacterium]